MCIMCVCKFSLSSSLCISLAFPPSLPPSPSLPPWLPPSLSLPLSPSPSLPPSLHLSLSLPLPPSASLPLSLPPCATHLRTETRPREGRSAENQHLPEVAAADERKRALVRCAFRARCRWLQAGCTGESHPAELEARKASNAIAHDTPRRGGGLRGRHEPFRRSCANGNRSVNVSKCYPAAHGTVPNECAL